MEVWAELNSHERGRPAADGERFPTKEDETEEHFAPLVNMGHPYLSQPKLEWVSRQVLRQGRNEEVEADFRERGVHETVASRSGFSMSEWGGASRSSLHRMAASVDRAVGTLRGLHAVGLLGDEGLRRRVLGQPQFVHAYVLSPPAEWHGSFDVVVEKCLTDPLLLLGHESSAQPCSALGSESDATAWRCPVAVE